MGFVKYSLRKVNYILQKVKYFLHIVFVFSGISWNHQIIGSEEPSTLKPLTLKTNFQVEGWSKGYGLLVDADAVGLGCGHALQVVVHQIVAVKEVENGDAGLAIEGAQLKLIGQRGIHPVIGDAVVGDPAAAVGGDGKSRAVHIVGGKVHRVEVQQGCQFKLVALILRGIEILPIGKMLEGFLGFA